MVNRALCRLAAFWRSLLAALALAALLVASPASGRALAQAGALPGGDTAGRGAADGADGAAASVPPPPIQPITGVALAAALGLPGAPVAPVNPAENSTTPPQAGAGEQRKQRRWGGGEPLRLARWRAAKPQSHGFSCSPCSPCQRASPQVGAQRRRRVTAPAIIAAGQRPAASGPVALVPLLMRHAC